MAAALFRKSKYSTISGIHAEPPAPHHAGLTAEPLKKKEIPEGLWEKCKKCEEIIYTKTREENLNLCPRCSYHYPMTAQQRIALLTDEGSFREIDADIESVDTLRFEGVASYTDKLAASKKKTGLTDAVVCGHAKLNGIHYALGVMDFRFLGASMGAVVGEKITRIIEFATAKKLPLIIVTASGGARMYEGMISLMQMAKTSAAVAKHGEAGLLYISVLTDPTTGGVSASFAFEADIIIAEKGALIGFAGPRVIEQTIRQKLPEGFQRAEFIEQKGFADLIVERREMKEKLCALLKLHCGEAIA